MGLAGRRARAYVAADSAYRLLTAGFRALHQGFWLGVLDHRHLDGLAGIQYTRWPDYRSDDYNVSGLRDWEAAAIRRHFPEGGSLLLGAAGGGREIVALARLGYRVEAFDCTEALVDYCRSALPRLGVAAQVHLAGPGQMPEGLGRYDGVIVGWGGYMHIPGRDRRIAFLRAVRRHVEAGAPLLLSFFTRSGPSRQRDWVHRIARSLRRLRRSADEVQPGDTLDGTYDHHFTRDELEAELVAGGFELLEFATTPYGHAVARAAGALGAPGPTPS